MKILGAPLNVKRGDEWPPGYVVTGVEWRSDDAHRWIADVECLPCGQVESTSGALHLDTVEDVKGAVRLAHERLDALDVAARYSHMTAAPGWRWPMASTVLCFVGLVEGAVDSRDHKLAKSLLGQLKVLIR